MKTTKYRWRSRHLMILLGLVLAGSWPARAIAVTNVFATQFEAVEGYSGLYDLVGQEGWQGQGSGGNGILTNYITGQGQQAYIGYFPPNSGDDQLIVWQPVNYSPLAASNPIVKFSVVMEIVDSSNGQYDDFYWSVYNSQTNNLFALDFYNGDTGIYYWGDGDPNFVYSTGQTFTNGVPYTLCITMDFAQNVWSATLSGTLLVANQPITSTGAPLDLGDVDAMWIVNNTNAPGDNYMLFDNYGITAEPPLATLQTLGWTNGSQFHVQLVGSSGYRYAIEATTNLVQWTPLKTNTVTNGFIDFADATAAGFAKRFYRARLLP